jgi:fatty acid desaturase
MSAAEPMDHDHHHDHGHHHSRAVGDPIKWYRCKIPREQFAALNRKSDRKGFEQTLGYLGILTTTGTLACIAAFHAPWYVTVLAFFLHGTCWNFMINGFHELLHESVFKTRRYNHFFVPVFGFLGWNNQYQFWTSHTEHHKFTLHAPDDLEVIVPQKESLRVVFNGMIFDFAGLHQTLRGSGRLALGQLSGSWEHHLFDNADPKLRAQLFNWSRFMLIGHAVVIVVSIWTGWWPIALAVSLPRFYGGWLFLLCNSSQHTALPDCVPDFRVCCRTVYLNPIVEFLYWHMNYHTEHHMYPGVPCYNLAQLHRAIKHDMPECPRGLLETWRVILEIQRRQALEPTYRFEPVLPNRAGFEGGGV